MCYNHIIPYENNIKILHHDHIMNYDDNINLILIFFTYLNLSMHENGSFSPRFTFGVQLGVLLMNDFHLLVKLNVKKGQNEDRVEKGNDGAAIDDDGFHPDVGGEKGRQ